MALEAEAAAGRASRLFFVAFLSASTTRVATYNGMSGCFDHSTWRSQSVPDFERVCLLFPMQ